MADGRMLSKKISLNEAVALLENDTHRLLFTWGISHLDIEGRISGSPKVFRAIVAPLLEHITSEKISKFFKDAVEKELIIRYQIGKDWFIQYPKFNENQRLRPDREAPSKIPSPPVLLPEDSRSSPGAEPEDSGVKLSLSKDNTPPTPPNGGNGVVPFLKVQESWNQNAPPLLPRIKVLDEKRKRLIKAAWQEHPELPWFDGFFRDIALSDHHSGKNDKGWVPDISWVLKERVRLQEKFDSLKDAAGPPGVGPKQKFKPGCPRCRGSGLYKSGETPDHQPIMSTCDCDKG